MTQNILFIGGSLNQTTMLHKIAQHMGDYNCYFTPYYADGIEGWRRVPAGWIFQCWVESICTRQKITSRKTIYW